MIHSENNEVNRSLDNKSYLSKYSLKILENKPINFHLDLNLFKVSKCKDDNCEYEKKCPYYHNISD